MTPQAAERDFPAGTVRWTDSSGATHVVSPNTTHYSAAQFFAAEYWDTELRLWRPVFDDDAAQPENSAPGP